MPRFAVAYINFFDNELHQEVVKAKNELAAAESYLSALDYDDVDVDSLEELKQVCFNTDCLISVLEL